jgi:DNA gyrase subunit A
MVTREQDAVRFLAVADTHDVLLFFTERGKVFSLKCYELPADSSRIAKGLAVINLFPIAEGEKVTAMVTVNEFTSGGYMLMATKKGEVKKTNIESFSSVRSSGLIAMDLEKGDSLIEARLAMEKNDIILVTRKGQSIRFPVTELRTSLRASGGVRAISLGKDDIVIGMDITQPDAFVLVITTGGYGKLTPVTDYPRQHRAGSGVRTFKTTEQTGLVATTRVVTQNQQVMIISANGIITRTPVKEKDPRKGITIQGRSTQGVRLMRLETGDSIVAIAAFE